MSYGMLSRQSMEEYWANVNLHTLSQVMWHILCIQLPHKAWCELSPPAYIKVFKVGSPIGPDKICIPLFHKGMQISVKSMDL